MGGQNTKHNSLNIFEEFLSSEKKNEILDLMAVKKDFYKRPINNVDISNLMKKKDELVKKNQKKGDSLKLPIILNKYKIICVLGKGAYGEVIKVKNIQTGEHFALKTINVSSSYGDVDDQERKKKIVLSAQKEWNVLQRLKHKNIVSYVESFLLPRSPVSTTSKVEERKTHFCLIMEYVRGSDLDTLLEYSEDKKFNVHPITTIVWFLKLLKTLNFLHKQGIVHRDLKPDNILIEYENLEQKEMCLKISDFGVARDLLREGRGSKLEGHIFYAPPEVLGETKQYDSKCDVWSLGIIFFQVYNNFSIESYQKKIRDLCIYVKEDAKLALNFCEHFNKTDIYQDTTYLELVLYLHVSNIFKTKLIDTYIPEDESFDIILSKMLCDEKDRLYTHQLLELSVIKTWDIILDEKKKTIFEEEEDQISIHGINTFIKHITNEKSIFKNILMCLSVILKRIKNDPHHDEEDIIGIINKENIINKLFTVVSAFVNFKNIIMDFFKVCLKFCQIDKKYIRIISHLIRIHGLVPLLKKTLFLFKNCEELDFFFLILIKECKTMKFFFSDSLKSFLLKYNANKNLIIYYILKELIQTLTKPKEILNLLLMVNKNNRVTFFKLNPVVSNNPNILEILYNKTISYLKEKIKKKKAVIKGLKHITNLCSIKQNKKHQIKLYLTNKENKLEFLSKNVSIEKTVELTKTGKCFKCLSRNDSPSYLITKNPIGKIPYDSSILPNTDKEEVVIMFYECHVINGGIRDEIELGILLEDRDKSMYIVYNTNKGNIKFFSQDKNSQETEEKFIDYLKLDCFSTDYIGFAVTNYNRFFITINNKVIKPFIKLNFETENGRVFALLNIKRNENLFCYINFGEKPFNFCFNNLKSLTVSKKRIELLKKKSKIFIPLIDSILKKYKDDYIIKSLIIFIHLKLSSLNPILENDDIIEILEKDETYSKISSKNIKNPFLEIIDVTKNYENEKFILCDPATLVKIEDEKEIKQEEEEKEVKKEEDEEEEEERNDEKKVKDVNFVSVEEEGFNIDIIKGIIEEKVAEKVNEISILKEHKINELQTELLEIKNCLIEEKDTRYELSIELEKAKKKIEILEDFKLRIEEKEKEEKRKKEEEEEKKNIKKPPRPNRKEEAREKNIKKSPRPKKKLEERKKILKKSPRPNKKEETIEKKDIIKKRKKPPRPNKKSRIPYNKLKKTLSLPKIQDTNIIKKNKKTLSLPDTDIIKEKDKEQKE